MALATVEAVERAERLITDVAMVAYLSVALELAYPC